MNEKTSGFEKTSLRIFCENIYIALVWQLMRRMEDRVEYGLADDADEKENFYFEKWWQVSWLYGQSHQEQTS